MTTNISKINQLLCEKAYTKQKVYAITQTVFNELKQVMQGLQEDIMPCIHEDAPNVVVAYQDLGKFESHLKFSGDTLVAMMHTNIFDFDDNHFIHQSSYIKEDHLREYCGMIQIYNFLSDSLLYNREQDLGYLVARIFINKDQHFFIEGKRPLSFQYADIGKHKLTPEILRLIVEECMLFCLNFDLLAPPLDAVNYITVHQKFAQSYSSGMPTGKRLGFRSEWNE